MASEKERTIVILVFSVRLPIGKVRFQVNIVLFLRKRLKLRVIRGGRAFFAAGDLDEVVCVVKQRLDVSIGVIGGENNFFNKVVFLHVGF